MNPRYMHSKFDSTCCDCGRHINKGERIRYLGRSQAQCSSCMPAEPNAAQNANAGVSAPATPDAWAAALAWDESTPEAGASIGGQPTGKLDPGSNVIAYERPKAPEVVTVPDVDPDRVDLASGGSPMATPAADTAPEFTDGERAEGMTLELLVVLVNAIDVAGVTGRSAIVEHCRQMANAQSSPRRASIWGGIARTVQSC